MSRAAYSVLADLRVLARGAAWEAIARDGLSLADRASLEEYAAEYGEDVAHAERVLLRCIREDLSGLL